MQGVKIYTELPRGTGLVEGDIGPKEARKTHLPPLPPAPLPQLRLPPVSPREMFETSHCYKKLCSDSQAKLRSLHGNNNSFDVKFVRDHFKVILEAQKKQHCVKSKMFDMVFGGDGAPAVGTVFLLSFMNVGKRLMSSKEAFLIFGADVQETDDVVEKYIARIVDDFDYLENNVFIVKGGGRMSPVEFRVGGDSSDMKMLCYLAGQVSNCTKYFTNFANVFKTGDERMKANLKFGDHWKPFTYNKMVEDGLLAEEYWKKLLNSKGSSKLKDLKAKLASHAGEVLKGRQVCRPRLGKYVLKAKADPLHIKNNVCFDVFVRLRVLIYGGVDVERDVSYEDLVDEQPSHVLVRFIKFIKNDMKLNRLSTKMIKWCNETRGNIEKSFVYRFQGEESNALLEKFPNLIERFLEGMTGLDREFVFHLFHICLLLHLMPLEFPISSWKLKRK